jgi:hypothetical protein
MSVDPDTPPVERPWHQEQRDEITAYFTRTAAIEMSNYADDPLPVPPFVIPTIGVRYFVNYVADDPKVHIMFHATLTDMRWSDDTPGDEEIDFEFDNDVTIHGNPILLPEGWEVRYEDGVFGLDFSLPWKRVTP